MGMPRFCFSCRSLGFFVPQSAGDYNHQKLVWSRKSVLDSLRLGRVLGHCEPHVPAVAKYFALLLTLPEAVWLSTQRQPVSVSIVIGFAKPFAPACWYANRVEVEAFVAL